LADPKYSVRKNIIEPSRKEAFSTLSQYLPSADTFRKAIASIESESASFGESFKRIYSSLPDFGEFIKTSFWRGLYAMEDGASLVLELFKRIFDPVLNWLEQKFGNWRSWLGIGPAAAAEGGLAPLAAGPGIALPPAPLPEWATPFNRPGPMPRGEGHREIMEPQVRA
jgi:hypothetical protein